MDLRASAMRLVEEASREPGGLAALYRSAAHDATEGWDDAGRLRGEWVAYLIEQRYLGGSCFPEPEVSWVSGKRRHSGKGLR